MIRSFNNWLLQHCENFSHWLQINCDKDSFFIANLLNAGAHIFISAVYIIDTKIWELSSSSGFKNALIVLMALVIVLIIEIFITCKKLTKQTKDTAYEKAAQGLRNDFDLELCNLTLAKLISTILFSSLLLGLSLTFLSVCLIVYSTLLIIFDHFLAVTPLTPNEVTRRKVFEGEVVTS